MKDGIERMAERISKLYTDDSTRTLYKITATLNAQKQTKITDVRKIISLLMHHFFSLLL